jgi:hypothetical protein
MVKLIVAFRNFTNAPKIFAKLFVLQTFIIFLILCIGNIHNLSYKVHIISLHVPLFLYSKCTVAHVAQGMKLIHSAVIAGIEIHEFHQINKTHTTIVYTGFPDIEFVNPLNGCTISVMA